jgi:hypothetical protein
MSTIMQELEALYRETGNPLYAWKAFAEEYRSGKALPGWIEDYLRECAGHLLDMAEVEARWIPEPGKRPISPGEAAKRTAQALRLTSPGRNKFADYRDIQRMAAVAGAYERRSTNAEETAEALADRAGVDPRTIQNWVGRARKLWEAQDKAKANPPF